MRSFIAIPLPEEIKDFLNRVQEILKTTQADVKWVKPANIHLTLKFLGEINNQQAEEIKKIIRQVCKDKASFQAILLSLGAFPRIDQPRVIWAGIAEGNEKIKQIVQELNQEIDQLLGLPGEKKPFTSHITLGRTRSGLKREKLAAKLKEFQNQIDEGPKKFKIDRIVLFKSTLTPQGPIYEELYSANLTTI
jgi:2'-5' RNA ligase